MANEFNEMLIENNLSIIVRAFGDGKKLVDIFSRKRDLIQLNNPSAKAARQLENLYRLCAEFCFKKSSFEIP